MSNHDASASTSPADQPTEALALDQLCHLTQWGVMLATGEDAADFLHKQLSNDILSLNDSNARLAAFCNVKGRMQASMIALHVGEQGIALLLPKDLLTKTLNRLSMFVMRAKCKLSDVSDQYQVMGFVRQTSADAAAPAWQRTAASCMGHTLPVVAWPAAHGMQAFVALAPSAVSAPAPTSDDDNHHAQALAAMWQYAYVASGVAVVSEATFEAFVPQMLNYESVGGVNFKKGCYPGQEVVARSQFRGAIKRRAMLAQVLDASADAAAISVGVSVGDEVWAKGPDTPDTPDSFDVCGMVAAVAQHNGQHLLCFSAQTAEAQAASVLRVGSATGPALQMVALPYAVLTDI
jgi:tRNA-modifying protein YgfZ